MKRLFAIVFLFTLFVLPLQATTLTGTIKYPDGSGVNGRIGFKLITQGSVSSAGSCGGPFAIVPVAESVFTLTAGAFTGSPTVVGNDCILPANTYYIVTVRDNNSQILFSQNWSIVGTTIDVGTIVPSPLGIGFSGAVLLSPVGNVGQSIASSILPASNGTYDFGTNTGPFRWRDGWFTRSIYAETDLRVGTAHLGAVFGSGTVLGIGDSFTGSGRWTSISLYPGTTTPQLQVTNGGLLLPTVDTTPTCTAGNGKIYFDGAAFQVCSGTSGPTALGAGGGGSVTGTGTTNTLAKFTGSSAIGNSSITDNGSITVLPNAKTVIGAPATDSGLTLLVNGYLGIQNSAANAGILELQMSASLAYINTTTTGSGIRRDLGFDASGGAVGGMLLESATPYATRIDYSALDYGPNVGSLVVGGGHSGTIDIVSGPSNASVLRLGVTSGTVIMSGFGTGGAGYPGFQINTGSTYIVLGPTGNIRVNDKFGIGVSGSATAYLNVISASDGTPNTSPFKLNISGTPTLLGTPEPGAIETDGSSLYFTDRLSNRTALGGGGGGSVTAASMVNHGAVFGTGTNTISSTATLTNGQIMIGSTGANPIGAALTNIGGLTITGGAGTISLGVLATAAAGNVLYGTAATGFANSNTFKFNTNSSLLVGVAVTDIADSGVIIANNFIYAVSGAANASVGALGYNAGATSIVLASGISGAGTYRPLAFYTNGTEHARLLTNGTFLFGMNASDANSGAFDILTLNGIGAATATTNASTIAISVGAGLAAINAGRTGAGTRLPMTFNTGAAETMRLDTSQNVGIGTSPLARLHVSTSAAEVSRLQSSGSTTTETYYVGSTLRGNITAVSTGMALCSGTGPCNGGLSVMYAGTGVTIFGTSSGSPGTPAVGSFTFFVDSSDSFKLKVVGGSGTVTTIALP